MRVLPTCGALCMNAVRPAIRRIQRTRCFPRPGGRRGRRSAAPGGVELDSDSQIIAEALRIHQQTVVTEVMPIGNLTNISDEERALIDQWFQAGAGSDEQ